MENIMTMKRDLTSGFARTGLQASGFVRNHVTHMFRGFAPGRAEEEGLL